MKLKCLILAYLMIVSGSANATVVTPAISGAVASSNASHYIRQNANHSFYSVNNALDNATKVLVPCYPKYKGGFFDALPVMFDLFFPYIMLSAAKMAISVVCWMRILDIVIRTVFAPIGMADFMYEGMSGHGFIYLKKMIASALQAAVIIAATRGYAILANMVGAGSGWFTMIIRAYTLIMITFKTQSLANDVIGA